MATVQHVFTELIPDLINADEYDKYPEGTLVRVRISVSENGVEVLGDGLRPELVEQVLKAIGGGPMEQMLCG